ncbi:MAG TPA: hypothetical protein VNJ71_11690 [Gemmatimonadales bacterium]|jgi:hypothetical protein|nr:hypothetical protein [Gemmatimonadales bacterium]
MNPRLPVSRDSLRRKLYRPEYYPPATELRVARDSTLWVRLATEPPRPLAASEALWLVCHWTGRSLRSGVAPAHLKVFDAEGDLVWGIEHDADDVPRVVRYRLVKDQPG